MTADDFGTDGYFERLAIERSRELFGLLPGRSANDLRPTDELPPRLDAYAQGRLSQHDHSRVLIESWHTEAGAMNLLFEACTWDSEFFLTLQPQFDWIRQSRSLGYRLRLLVGTVASMAIRFDDPAWPEVAGRRCAQIAYSAFKVEEADYVFRTLKSFERFRLPVSFDLHPEVRSPEGISHICLSWLRNGDSPLWATASWDNFIVDILGTMYDCREEFSESKGAESIANELRLHNPDRWPRVVRLEAVTLLKWAEREHRSSQVRRVSAAFLASLPH